MAPKVIKIDEVEYIRADSVQQKSEPVNYHIVRTRGAGVFAGEIVKREGTEVEMKNARRLWYWEGAASLSQLAMEGVKRPNACKFPCEVNKVILIDVIEILECTKTAQDSIKGVKVWAQ